MVAGRRLADAQAFGGACQMTFLHHSDQRSQVREVQHAGRARFGGRIVVIRVHYWTPLILVNSIRHHSSRGKDGRTRWKPQQ
ncbi:Uncharacterised protein [Bordetella pertussis]|nr:Uncharacterised protein [Bordetella pertussis]